MKKFFCCCIVIWSSYVAVWAEAFPGRLDINSGWQLQEAGKFGESGEQISKVDFQPNGWCQATVPGTVLTTLVNNHIYPEPLYGENNRPDKIPETLCHTPYWYRASFVVPRTYLGRTIWLNFDGINYAAEVWVNGHEVGRICGAFTRGAFDISSVVSAGKEAALAVLISPQPNPGIPHEHTIANGLGQNGGITALDGPTFLCSIGWDWIPAIRDRNTGIWRKVFLSASGPVVIKDPLVTSDLPLPSLQTADIAIQTTLKNTSDQTQKGVLKGSFGEVSFRIPVELAGHSTQLISLDHESVPQLHMVKPRLWWPNGFGPQNLYTLRLSFGNGEAVSDEQAVSFGIRKINYAVPDSENLTLSVNGVRVLCKGGDWGMDEAMKRIPHERLEAQIRMHQLANYTMIRNWVGQSTSEDFYELCDKYGIMVWDEFFQPNPLDGPNPTNLDVYLDNVREKLLRFRNHPSIAVWCARNEGYAPKDIDNALQKLLGELEPVRIYQPSSTAGRGVNSGGPYYWRPPREFYEFSEPFKTEIGSVSIPTLESIKGMMPEKDWRTINDDWAEHDFAKGAQGGDTYLHTLNQRYGQVANLADFARKGQLANYEAFRAMYEGRNSKLFKPCTGILTWMSNPAQPSFVWQIYHHDLEPNAALFATRKACEPIHVQLNEKEGRLEVINNLPVALSNVTVRLEIYNLDGTLTCRRAFAVAAAPSSATDIGAIEWPSALSSVFFVKMYLHNQSGKLLSDNFYWRARPEHPDELQALGGLPVATLGASVKRRDADGKCLMEVALHNPGPGIAVMAHLQLRRKNSLERVLPVFYSENYISLVPGESKKVTIETAKKDLGGEAPLVMLDGWNIAVAPSSAPVVLNRDAQVERWPVRGLDIEEVRLGEYRIRCGGEAIEGFEADRGASGGNPHAYEATVERACSMAGPAELYKAERWGDCVYSFPMKPLSAGQAYAVRLHFAESTFAGVAKRSFNVELNGRRVLTDFDILKEAGGKDKALVKQFTDIVPDDMGHIVIRFSKGSADEPKVNAIEIAVWKKSN